MFQDSYASLDPRMRAGSILREPLIVQGMGSRREQLAKVKEMLGKVGPARVVDRALPARVLRRAAAAARLRPRAACSTRS